MRLLKVAALMAAGAMCLTSLPAQAAPRQRAPELVFAQFNVCKTECEAPAPSWSVRRDRVARVIAASGADVVGIDEATNWSVPDAETQWDDIRALAVPAGYAAPTLDVDECGRGTACDHTARLLYRAASVSEVEFPDGQPGSGSSPVSVIVGGLDGQSAIRQFTWAYLQGANGTGPFLAIALHMPNQKDAVRESARRTIARALGPWVDSMNAARGIPGTPAVLMADLNSNSFQNPKGAQKVLASTGWLDAIEAPSRKNTSYSTVNMHSSNLQYNGFPPKPVKYSGPASRIDYIMGRGVKPVSYEVVLFLTKSGGFDPDYQASDHQMVRATFAFR